MSCLHCPCGQRITIEHVQVALFCVNSSPAMLSLHYRCPACQREGAQHLTFGPSEAAERARFENLGQIDLDEVIEFGRRLENLTAEDLAALADDTA